MRIDASGIQYAIEQRRDHEGDQTLGEPHYGQRENTQS
jgi:hypothetical protein